MAAGPIGRASGITAAATLPPLIEIWSLLVVVLAPATLVVVRNRAALVRGSPAELQRFLF